MSGFVRGKLLVGLLGLSVVFSPLSVPSQSPRTVPNGIAALIGDTPTGEGDWKPDKGKLGGVAWSIRRGAPVAAEPL